MVVLVQEVLVFMVAVGRIVPAPAVRQQLLAIINVKTISSGIPINGLSVIITVMVNIDFVGMRVKVSLNLVMRIATQHLMLVIAVVLLHQHGHVIVHVIVDTSVVVVGHNIQEHMEVLT